MGYKSSSKAEHFETLKKLMQTAYNLLGTKDEATNLLTKFLKQKDFPKINGENDSKLAVANLFPRANEYRTYRSHAMLSILQVGDVTELVTKLQNDKLPKDLFTILHGYFLPAGMNLPQ